jgi:hypothetical protein
MKLDMKEIMRILAQRQLQEMKEDDMEEEVDNEMDDEMEDEDKLEKMKRTRPKMKSKEMQDLVDKKRKAIILLMMKNKRK